MKIKNTRLRVFKGGLKSKDIIAKAEIFPLHIDTYNILNLFVK